MRIDATSTLFLNPQPKTVESIEKPESPFASWLGEKIISTNGELNEADKALTELASGKSQNLHQSMLTLEQAKLSFEYLQQIRNRLLSAYQELLREQI